MTTPSVAVPRRRWWTLSLRSLMVVVLLLGAPLGWMASRAARQKAAVAAIRARQGNVTFDYAMRDPANLMKPVAKEPPGPAWLRRWVGDEYFQDVASVQLTQPVIAADLAEVARLDHLQRLVVGDVAQVGGAFAGLKDLRQLEKIVIGGPGLTDEALAPLGKLTSLTLLWLDKTSITDAGLVALEPLQRLRALDLNHSPGITSAGVARLVGQLPLLEDLELNGTSIDDSVLPTLGRQPRLKRLILDDTRVTDEGMKALANLRSLETLFLRNTAIGDRGLAALAPLTRLKRLWLTNTRITGAGLASLAGMVALNELSLAGTKVDAAGLQYLRPLQQLKSLNLTSTLVTDEGVADLGQLVALNVLHLSRTKITDAGLLELAPLKSLVNLLIIETGVTAAGEAEFRRVSPTTKLIQRVIRPRPPLSATAAATSSSPEGAVARRLLEQTAQLPPAQTPGELVNSSSPKPSRVLDRLGDKHRPVVVFGPRSDDPRVVKQQHSWVGPLPEAGVKDRDILVVEVLAEGQSREGGQPLSPEEASELRAACAVAPEDFVVVLVGRDGGEKARWTTPVSAQEVFGKVDAMPMRQEEVRAKGGGSE